MQVKYLVKRYAFMLVESLINPAFGYTLVFCEQISLEMFVLQALKSVTNWWNPIYFFVVVFSSHSDSLFSSAFKSR